MYLIQEKLLKKHHIGSFFYELPPIADLAVVIRRLLMLGFILLTAGLFAVAAGGSKPASNGNPAQLLKAAWPAGVWLMYGGILAANLFKRLSPRRTAMLAIGAFVLALSTLWGLNFISDKVHF